MQEDIFSVTRGVTKLIDMKTILAETTKGFGLNTGGYPEIIRMIRIRILKLF